MDALYKFVNEQWNPKPLRDREEPTADELRHSIGLTLTTDPAFTNSVASREWLRVQTTDVGDLAAAQSVVVRNNSGRVSRAAALAAADAIVSGVPPSFVLPPSDTVAIARSASATDLVVSPRPGLLSPSSTAAVVATTSAASSSARGGRRRTADGMSNGVGASHSVSSHQQQNNSHQHNNTDDHSGSNAAPRKRHKLPQPEYGHVCKCGATRPAEGSRSKWKLLDAIGDFVCHACYASDETVCPLCQTQYYEDENDPWICCERCDRWVHARCDQITDISLFDDSNPRRLVYLCALCREKAGADDEAAAAVTASIAAAAAAAAAAHATTSTVASDAVDHAGHKRGRGAIKREADPSHSPGAAATAATSSAATTTAATTTGVATAVTTTSTGEERKRGSGRRRKSQTPPSNLQALVAPLQPSVALDRIETKLWSELDADQPVVALAADRAGAALTNLEVAFAEAVHTQKLQLQRELNQRDAAADEAFQAAVAEASRVRHAAREAAESNVAERFAAQFELQRNTFLEKQSAMLDGSLPPRPRGRGRPSKADQKAAAIAATIAATNGGSTATPLSAGVSPSTGSKKRPSSHAHASDDSSHSSTESAENAAAVVVAAAAAAAKHGGNQRDADDDDEEEEEEDEEDDGREDDDDDDYEGADDEPVHAAKKAKKASSQAVVVPKPAPPKSQSKSQQRAVEPIKPDRHADADGIDEDDEEAHGGEEDEDEDEDEDGADGDDENQQQPANALTSFAKIATSRGVVHNATSAAAARIRRTESVDTMHLLCAFSETLEEDRKAPAAAESPKKTSMAPPIVVVTQPAAE
jgi:hypothetical protein